MSNHIVGLSSETRRAAQELWNMMYDNYGFKFLPRELVNRYDEIFRSILSEVVTNQVQYNIGTFKSYLSALDYATWIHWLELANPATKRELQNAANLGSEIAEDIVSEINDEEDNLDDAIDMEGISSLDYAVGNSVLIVMPSTNEFNVFERCVWYDLNDANVVDTYFQGDLLISIRPGLSRMLLTDNYGITVT